MAKSISLMMELLKRKPSCRKVHLPYKQSRDSKIKITDEDRTRIEPLMAIVHEVLGATSFDIHISSSNLIRVSAFTLGNLKFDIDASTKNIRKVVNESEIRFSKDKLLKALESDLE